MNIIEIEILKKIDKNKIGKILKISVDENNIPLDPFWRSRFKDAEIDQCLKVKESCKKDKKVKNSNEESSK